LRLPGGSRNTANCLCSAPHRPLLGAQRFLTFLTTQVSSQPLPPRGEAHPTVLLVAFRHWMECTAGTAQTFRITVHILDFLTTLESNQNSIRPKGYDLCAGVCHVRHRQAKNVVTSPHVRAFLIATGRCMPA